MNSGPKHSRWWLAAALCGGGAAAVGAGAALAQSTPPSGPAGIAQQESAQPTQGLGSNPELKQTVVPYANNTEALLKTPISGLFPGGISTQPVVNNPVANDPTAAQRGMAYFNAFNCVGCHAANGGGGMGRSLSNRFFQYGSSPANIYLSIVQGRPNGMPAWGGVLPDTVIWDIVAYIKQISSAPVTEWGHTISLKAMKIEQVPAEFQQTANPWAYTEPFSFGQKPSSGGRK